MGHSASARTVVLHGLRVKGFAETPSLAESTGLDQSQVSDQLATLSAAGLVAHRQGVISGWHLTPAGRAEAATALVAEVEKSGATASLLRDQYERFVELDPTVKAICTAWQVRDLEAGVVNDHTDADYDAAVVARLVPVHREAVTVVDGLAAALDRFAPYRDRLDAAHERVQAGDRDALTKPLTASYHDVWMELHEDLLLTLGLERSGP